jgi:uncharacterized heparinase superfamily protein
MNHAMRLFHTVRHLRIRQIAYRLYYRWRRLSVPPLKTGNQALVWSQDWHSPQWQSSHMGADGQFQFLNELGRVDSPGDWNNPTKAKLWLYNLHYLDELNTQNADDRVATLNRLIDRWMDDNPPPHGNGWEPYPLSLRLVNLVKWQMRQHYPGSRLLDSIQQQASALSQQIEYHIMANHLFANGKALVFAGAALADGERFLRQGLAILDAEIPEQFLADGAHFELSPMYHAILLWDLCDLVNLAKRSALPELQSRQANWAKVVERGLVWLSHLCHPDGDIAFFNDSTLGIAPRYVDLRQYTDMLNITHVVPDAPSLAATHLQESGYITIASGPGVKLILDVGRIGPVYQPGHAHADTLSFELSLFGQRVLVNSGISEYGTGVVRSDQRSTRVHNTVVVDGKNSSDVWGGFRVGQRALPDKPRITPTDEQVVVNCSHNGYRTLFNPLIHSRQWRLTRQHCQMTDTLCGNYQRAEAHYHLHPDVQVRQQTADRFELTLPAGETVSMQFTHHVSLAVENSQWYPGFGVTQANRCLVATFTQHPLRMDMTW